MAEERARPPGVWFVGIVGIVLGLFGSFGSAFQLGSMAFQDSVIEMQERTIERFESEEERAFQLSLQRSSLEVARQWRVPTMATQIANLLASLMLLVAAVLLFLWNPNAPLIFLAAAGLSILVDSASAGVSIAGARQTIEAMSRAAGELAPAGNVALTGAVLQASGSVGICWGLTWLAAKLAFYVGGIVYVRRRTVRELFN